MTSLSPGLVLIIGAFLLPPARGVLRSVLVLALPLLTLLAVWLVPESATATTEFLGYDLLPVRPNPLGRLFATVFAVATFGGALYGLRHARVLELAAAFFYAGSAIAVTFAGDLISFFIFWEMMTLGATVVIWSAGTRAAYGASMRYLSVHLLGGVLLMLGITMHMGQGGSLHVAPIDLGGAASWLMLIGILVNAGAPPLSAWVADAYPEATPSGMVFLSAYTTKVAVYGLLMMFAGAGILVPVGLFMVFYGIIYALLENDLRRMFAYSIVNQVGFMVVAAGIGTPLAISGAAAHAFAHIIYKALLLMSAGSVVAATGLRRMSDLGGLFRSMPTTAILGLVGALSISAVPFTSGFPTKSLIISAAADQHLGVVWLLLEMASAGSIMYAAIKFPWMVFLRNQPAASGRDPSWNMRAAMWMMAILCVAIGVLPGPLYSLLPNPVDYVPYTGDHLVAQFQLLLFSSSVFILMLPRIRQTLTITLDLDWLYRRLGLRVVKRFVVGADRAQERLEDALTARAEQSFDSLSQHHGPQGLLGRSWPTGSMVLWVAVLLGAYLVISLF